MGERITIIGAGPGGYVAAIRAAQLGAQVTLIEQERVGGTCLNRGCIPSKVMKTAAEMFRTLQKPRDFGLALGGEISPDMKALMARKEAVVRNQAKGILDLLQKHGVRYTRGFAALAGSNRVAVKPAEGNTSEVIWDRLILALGSRPLDFPAFPFDGRRILSSSDALSLHEIPGSLLIVGGGVIGCEFAFIFSSLGARVTVVEAMSRLLPLPAVDKECSTTIQREMKKGKIDFMLNRVMERVEEKGEKLHVTIGPSPFAEDLKKSDRKPLAVEAEKILLCVGRRPNTSGLGLEEMGVKLDEKGWIAANERMETGVPHVYAIGDVLGPSRPMLAHVASREGLIAAENAGGEKKAMNYDAVPAAIFTMPEIACVGLTEAQAEEQGYHVRAESVLFRTLGKAHVLGEIAGFAKIVSEAESGRILGVHILGPHATDLIGEGTLAVKAGCTLEDLAETVHAHPTLPEIMQEVSFKALGRSLHG